jgi:protease-4
MPLEEENRYFDTRSILLFIILPLLVGIVLSTFIYHPVIGIIEIKDPIDSVMGKAVVEQIRYASNHPEYKALVLLIDSPGGTVNDSELIYLELNHLRKKIPIVSMVEGVSASGAYYISMATDYIFSNPSAMVGNVGVIGQLPPIPIILEETYSTGPYKFWGSSRDTYMRQIDMMKRGFLQAVELGRGERLLIPIDQVSKGEIYPANVALQLGLIDRLGSQSEAIEKAASLAYILNYKVTSLNEVVGNDEDGSKSFYALDKNGESTGYPKEQGFYFLYIPDFKGDMQ